MNARRFLGASLAVAIGLVILAAGCRTTQTAQVVKPGEKELVGSHEAGGETFGPLVDECGEQPAQPAWPAAISRRASRKTSRRRRR